MLWPKDYYQVDFVMPAVSSIGQCCQMFTEVAKNREDVVKELQHSLQPVIKESREATDRMFDSFGVGLISDNLAQSIMKQTWQPSMVHNENPRILSCTAHAMNYAEDCKTIRLSNSTRGPGITIQEER